MQQPQIPERFDTMPLWRQLQILDRLIPIAALTVMIFLRRDIGYRLLKPIPLFLMATALAAVATLAGPANPDARFGDLFVFAIFAFLFGMCQRANRWREYKRGQVEHSYYIGTSRFHFRWLPRFLRRNRRIERYVDPLFCVASGLFLLQCSIALACWVILAGLAVAIYEGAVREKEQNVDLDMMDGLIASQIHSQNIEQFEEFRSPGQRKPHTGLSTGVGYDIQKKIKNRKTK